MIKAVIFKSFWLALLIPDIASAHSLFKNVHNFYNGMLHPLFVPAHILMIISIGLFLGQQGPQKSLKSIALFFLMMVFGLLLAGYSASYASESVLLLITTITGILVSVKPNISKLATAILAAVAGLFLGMDSTQDGLSGNNQFVALFGSGLGIYLFFLYPMSFAESFSKSVWQKITIRIIGSWLAASSIMVLALSLRPDN